MAQFPPIHPRAAAELPPNPNHNRLMIDGLLLLLGAVGLAIISHRMSRLRDVVAPGDLTALRLGLGLSTTAIAGGVISIAAQLCPARRPPEQLNPALAGAPAHPRDAGWLNQLDARAQRLMDGMQQLGDDRDQAVEAAAALRAQVAELTAVGAAAQLTRQLGEALVTIRNQQGELEGLRADMQRLVLNWLEVGQEDAAVGPPVPAAASAAS